MLRRTFVKASAALAFAATIAMPAFAATAGQDYQVLEKPLPGGEGKIVKIWSYDCPFCFKYDAGVDPKVMPGAEQATGLHFEMMHLETKGKFGRAASEFLAYCQLEDQKAGVTSVEDAKSLYKKAKDAWYQAYHKKGERWAAGEEAFLKTALDATGITADA
ncbi:MAG: thiol:disulfide interchange protein, partial [Sutterella sp.]|nr:thiol:disulfide interchange protein [Sutterella sp.]